MTPPRACSGCEQCLPDAPCARCPSPILPPPAPRVSELVLSTNPVGAFYVVDEYHPGCWAAELQKGTGS